jgi:FkbM family methyltransferase
LHHCRLEIPGLDSRLLLRTHALGDTCVSGRIREHHIWEPYETALVVRFLKAGDVFLDAGANIGYYTVLASAIVGSGGKVIAYEPDEDNFRLLCESLSLNQAVNVIPVMAAVSDYDGSGRLHLSLDNSGDHRLFDSADGRPSREIPVIHAGRHLRSVTGRVNFIKIDTQGSEYRVLNGLKDIVRENRDHLTLMMEFWPYGLRRSGASASELLDLLESFDMTWRLIDHCGRQLWLVQPDFLRLWAEETDADPANEGFINLLFSNCREE